MCCGVAMAATVAAAVSGAGGVVFVGGGGVGVGVHHHQLTRSLERILEEACLSGELVLTNRKLKDFPKCGSKYDLTDTVIAGESFISFSINP